VIFARSTETTEPKGAKRRSSGRLPAVGRVAFIEFFLVASPLLLAPLSPQKEKKGGEMAQIVLAIRRAKLMPWIKVVA
jgi:hypothetical protein